MKSRCCCIRIRLVLPLVWSFWIAADSCRALASIIPLFFDSSNSLHRDIQYHPEQPARIVETIQALQKEFRATKSEDNSSAAACCVVRIVDVAVADVVDTNKGLFLDEFAAGAKDSIEKEPFSGDELEHAKQMLLRTHKESMVTKLQDKCRNAKELRQKEGKDALGHMGYLDPDTFVTTETFDVCLRATAAWIRAVREATKASTPAAMALTRPPGHHATKDASNGFCIFNFAAAAAVHVMLEDPNKRVSILDWDVHYGQGVADIMQQYPNARYVSIHQTPAFPYMGERRKISGEHKNILTIPIAAETSWTCGYRQAFAQALDFCSSESWSPDVVIVCAGYDALDSDELASVSLQAQDYGEMARQLRMHLKEQQANNTSSGTPPALMLGLEGGYQLSHYAGGGNLQQAVVETIKGLLD